MGLPVKPQNVAVLALLRAHPEGVTTLQALDAVGCFRLGARIHDLKTKHGFVIDSELVTLISGKRVARYALREKPVQLTLDAQQGAPQPATPGGERSALLVTERRPLAASRSG